ncbi:hypothetical protein [Actinomadura sp. CNU-125]|uniref:hypothetical protein n=1 Tax=Actinomadura sp. CNU-125 TaxID=1904961 RepID=UPI0021CCF6D7|nr:hypothetical protein [Actinomadura sp. CNU-125]
MSLTLLATTHRVAPGLLTWRAWERLRTAARVLAPAGHPLLPSLADAEIAVEQTPAPDPAALVAAARGADVVWVAAPKGTRRCCARSARSSSPTRWTSRCCTARTTCPARGCSTWSR